MPASNHTLWKKQPPGSQAEARAYAKITKGKHNQSNLWALICELHFQIRFCAELRPNFTRKLRTSKKVRQIEFEIKMNVLFADFSVHRNPGFAGAVSEHADSRHYGHKNWDSDIFGVGSNQQKEKGGFVPENGGIGAGGTHGGREGGGKNHQTTVHAVPRTVSGWEFTYVEIHTHFTF